MLVTFFTFCDRHACDLLIHPNYDSDNIGSPTILVTSGQVYVFVIFVQFATFFFFMSPLRNSHINEMDQASK